MRAFGDPEPPSARHELEELPREDKRQRLLILRDRARKAHAAANDGAVLDAQGEPGPQGAERVAAPQTRQLGELRRIGHVGGLARVADRVSRTLIVGSLRQHIGTFVQGTSQGHRSSLGVRHVSASDCR